MINNKLTYISLFSSAGVGCYGFKIEDFECIATNEIISKRLNVQRINNKCKYDSGYIEADIKDNNTKKLIYDEIDRWRKLGNDRVDVVIATPPCQGMSVANHKKSNNEIERNSLIRESVDLIKNINPRFFLFENVAAFWKTGCIDRNGNVVSIGDMITEELGEDFLIHNEVLNFKNYGSNSSRTRTLVIGVYKRYAEEIAPIELMPDYSKEKTLFDVIGNMKSLSWGEYDPEDFYHSFRIYPKHMLAWIENLKEGQSAFDNESDELKPHRIIDGKLVLNKAKNGDKYTRQIYSKVAPCIHTRNDQLASQNTIHPVDSRVFSIRELMKMMTIPNSFKWMEDDLKELNKLSDSEKQKISKREEMNIRQSIGEAVPTYIFQQIARKMKNFMLKPLLTYSEIKDIIDKNNLDNISNLKSFIKGNIDVYNISTLSKIIEYSNAKRQKNSAYFTNKYIIQEIFRNLPDIAEDEISIIEPSVGAGNFLPFIFKKYEQKSRVDLTVVDVDSDIIDVLKLLYNKKTIPRNFNIKFICEDFMKLKHRRVDLIIGNPPFSKISGDYRNNLLRYNYNQDSTNLAEFIFEKAISLSEYVSMIMPKNILNTPEFEKTRELANRYKIDSIIDFGENGFKGVLIETINIIINTSKVATETKVISTTLNINMVQKSDYIFDNKLPYWIIYRNQFFDDVYKKMRFGIFDVFRDRQITNNNTVLKKTKQFNVRVLKSRNILDDGEIQNISEYDSYIDEESLSKLSVSKYINRTDVYLTPNMTYKPRLIRKQKGYVVNGSIAILIPKNKNLEFSSKQLQYIASDEFREFYRIARNHQTRSLNVDKISCHWFGKNEEL